jgi:hypothetical protein
LQNPIDKANIIENQFRAHDLCDCDPRRHVEALVEALLATVDEDIPLNFRLCDVSTETQSLKQQWPTFVMSFQMNVSGIFQEDLLCI